MSKKKIIILVDCENDDEKTAVQKMLASYTEQYDLKASSIISMYPFIERNKLALSQIINNISKSGKAGIMKSIALITQLK